MRIKITAVAAFILLIFCLPLTALAENDPRDSICAPDGTSLFLFYYRHYSGNELYANGTKVNNNVDYDLDMAMFRYGHFVGLGDWTWSYDLLQPVGDLDMAGNSASGLGDTNLATHINTPFLIKTDTMSYMMSVGFYLCAPTGDYDSAKAVNLGANRWSYKFEYTPLILMTKNFTLELTGDAAFYTDNDDFGAASANLETDPLFGIQTHVTYNVTDTFWVGLSHYYNSGAENAVNGVDQNDETDTQALKFSASFKLAPNVDLMLQYSSDIERDNGLKQSYIGTRIVYAW